MNLTRQQREALKRVFDRHPIPADYDDRCLYHINCDGRPQVRNREVYEVMTYRQFRKTVQPGYGCAMVPWAGMWLGIEKDGYTHS